jgi:protein required for attachment to host cells
MSKLAIPHDTWIFIGDGQKALFLRNAGDEKFINLKAERVFAEVNPPSREQGTDRPGRGFKRAGTTQRSAMETTDWHELEKQHFVQHAAAAMEQLVRDRDVRKLIIVAPPRALADLRETLPPETRSKVIAEINKDLTKHTIADIEKHLG